MRVSDIKETIEKNKKISIVDTTREFNITKLEEIVDHYHLIVAPKAGIYNVDSLTDLMQNIMIKGEKLHNVNIKEHLNFSDEDGYIQCGKFTYQNEDKRELHATIHKPKCKLSGVHEKLIGNFYQITHSSSADSQYFNLQTNCETKTTIHVYPNI